MSERLIQTHNRSERVGADGLPHAIVRRSMSRTVARWAAPRPRVQPGTLAS